MILETSSMDSTGMSLDTTFGPKQEIGWSEGFVYTWRFNPQVAGQSTKYLRENT